VIALSRAQADFAVRRVNALDHRGALGLADAASGSGRRGG